MVSFFSKTIKEVQGSSIKFGVLLNFVLNRVLAICLLNCYPLENVLKAVARRKSMLEFKSSRGEYFLNNFEKTIKICKIGCVI